MPRIRVATTIDAGPKSVWASIRDIGSHVGWMEDAVAIRFTSDSRDRVGTTFECDTKVGPFRLTDLMEVTEWDERKRMGIRHVGLVTGTGRFTLRKARGNRTRFTWDERLRFPWWMGGPLAATVGAPLLKRIWRRNLRNLKHQVESG